MENVIEQDYLERLSTLSVFPRRKLTWAEWLTERAGEEPAARRVYEAMRRRLSKEDRATALAAAAAAKLEREASAAAAAAEAAQKKARAEAAETKLKSLLPAGEKDVGTVGGGARMLPSVPAAAPASAQVGPTPEPPTIAKAAPAPARPASPPAYRPPPQPPTMSASIPVAATPPSDAETSGPPPDLEAVLREARAAKWLVFRIGERYQLAPSSVASIPKADEHLRNPAWEAHVQVRLAEMFAEQEKEIDVVVEALGRSSSVKLHPQFAFVLKESVSPEIQPLLQPRPFDPRIVDAARARLEFLSKAAERPPEPAVSPTIPVETGTILEKATEAARRPVPVVGSPVASSAAAPVSQTPPPKPEFSLARDAVSTPVAYVPPVPEAATTVRVTTSGKASPPTPADAPKRPVEEAPHAPIAKPGPVPPKSPSEATLDRKAYEAMFGEIEEYGYHILIDPASNRPRLENPPREWAPFLSSRVLAAETDRRLKDIHEGRLEIARVAGWIQAAAKAPGHLLVDGENVRFPHFNEDQFALFRKHRDSEDISIELAAAREAQSASEEDNRLAQLHAHLRGQLGRD
ncbi:MAG: hypothetical protein JO238_09090 [Alphaproteobacteria bacterium]|nr:hypothetical protein [Alphaproteobacteria bacterium]